MTRKSRSYSSGRRVRRREGVGVKGTAELFAPIIRQVLGMVSRKRPSRNFNNKGRGPRDESRAHLLTNDRPCYLGQPSLPTLSEVASFGSTAEGGS
jgi:hypothetical protein